MAFTQSATDTITINSGAYLQSTASHGLQLTGASQVHTVNINGVAGSFNGAGFGVFADAFTGTANITIGASGTVFSQNSALLLQGAATITNNGIINSAAIGINKTGAAGTFSRHKFRFDLRRLARSDLYRPSTARTA